MCTWHHAVILTWIEQIIIEGITTIVALFDGLVIICRVIAILVVKMIRRETRRVSPST